MVAAGLLRGRRVAGRERLALGGGLLGLGGGIGARAGALEWRQAGVQAAARAALKRFRYVRVQRVTQ